MLRPDCTPWIHSFAHGRTTYELRLDHRAVESALNRARPDEVVGLFVRLALRAELDKGEIEQLRELVHRISGTGKAPSTPC
jgi:hypothetical protein